MFARVPDFSPPIQASQASSGSTPASTPNVMVTAIDLKRTREHLGIDPNDLRLGGDTAALIQLSATALPNAWRTIEPKRWQEKVGFSHYSADRAIEIEALPSFSITVLEGTFDAPRITETMRTSGALGTNPAT